MTTSATTARGRATRQRIVRVATELIYRNGVAAVRLNDVETAAGVGRSQLYHYFSSRDDLIRAVVEETIDIVLSAQEPMLSLDSMDGIKRWFDDIVANAIRPEGVGDCAIGLLAAQLSEHDDVTRHAFLDAFARWEAPLIHGLSRMQDRGQLVPHVDVAELASLMMAAIQGGLLLAHVRRDSHQIRLALRGAQLALSEALTTPSPGVEAEGASGAAGTSGPKARHRDRLIAHQP